MSSFRVVLDACVLIPAALRDTLLRAADAGLYRLHWSEDILTEVERNLIEHGMTSADDARYLIDTMRTYFEEAAVEGYQTIVSSMPNQSKDRHVLAAAVVVNAEVIVTSNLRDFPEDALKPYGIEAQSPDEFLENLFDLDPDGMTRIIVEQARDLNSPQMTVDDVLRAIGQHAPRFAQLVCAYQHNDW